MGGSLQRIEVLLFGLMLLLGGLLAAAFSVVPPDRRVDMPEAAVPSEMHAPMPDSQAANVPWPSVPMWVPIMAERAVAPQLLLLIGSGGLLVIGIRRIIAQRQVLAARFGWRSFGKNRLPKLTITRPPQIDGSRWVARFRRCVSFVRQITRGIPRLMNSSQPLRWRSFGKSRLPKPATPQPHVCVARPADDCAALVVAALAEIWREQALASRIAWIDVQTAGHTERVIIGLDVNPADETALLCLPQRLAERYPAWRIAWRWRAQRGLPVLLVELHGQGEPPRHSPMLAALMTHGRDQVVRYHSFDLPGAGSGDLSRHLALIGPQAADAARECLTTLLFAHPPEALALVCLDTQQRLGLPAGVPHLLDAPGDTLATIAEVRRALRRGVARNGVRLLLLAIVEPDAAAYRALPGLLHALRRYAEVPVRLLIVQEHVPSEGREACALLPTLDVARVARWSNAGHTLSGRPTLLDLHTARTQLSTLPPRAGGLPPVLWDAAAPAPTVPSTVSWLDLPDTPNNDPLAERLAHAIGLRQAPPHAVAPQASVAEPSGIWPNGAGLNNTQIAALVERLLSDPSILAATPPGVTKGRLARMLPPEQRNASEALFQWLDRAGVLHEPTSEALRRREPRLLQTTDRDWIAARLQETRPL